MSNNVFPSEIGQGTTGANQWGFHLPIRKTPSYKTLLQTPANNTGELGVSLTQFPVWIFDLDLAWMRGDFSAGEIGSIMQTIVGFFGQAQGRADTWLYFDPADNGSLLKVVNSSALLSQLVPYSFGTGDGVTKAFPMTRSVGGMLDLIQNFVSGFPLVYVNGVYTTAYTLSQSGIITFNSAPGSGQSLVWYGQFYFRCRFMDDEWGELEAIVNQIWRNPKMRFKSVLV